MKLLPCEIYQNTDPKTGMHITDVRVADDVLVFSEKTFETPDGPAGIYLALTHVIAVTRREAHKYTDFTNGAS
jgi:hypothetical protein